MLLKKLQIVKLQNLNFTRNSVARFFSNDTKSRKPSYFHHIGKDPLLYRTTGQQLAISAELFGDREAVVSYNQDVRYTFAEVLEKADRLAAGYRALGLKRGDLFAIWAPSSADWYLNNFAAARAGMTMVGLNPAYQASEILYCLNKVGAKAIFVNHKNRHQNYYDILLSIIPELECSVDRVIVSDKVKQLKTVVVQGDEKLPGTYNLTEVLRLADDRQIAQISDEQDLIQPEEPCNIQFTSGTTGQPKAVVMSHFSFVNNGADIAQRLQLDTKPHRICIQNPLFHAFGVVVGIMTALHQGATLVVPTAGYDVKASLRAIEKERCTGVYGTPTMFVDLLKAQKEVNADISSLEFATTGGSTCTPTMYKDIKTELGLRAVTTVYGMTETTAAAFFSLPNESDENAFNTVGHLVNHMEAKVVDDNGQTVAMGEPGELLVRGYETMLEYFGDVKATSKTIGLDKWLHTGDQFVLNDEGYGMVVGRIKDIIIRGGENISPKEVEDLLITHPEVIESHVYGVPDERLGEVVCVSIRTTEAGQDITRNDILKFCEGKLAKFKIPQYIRFVDRFPKTASGKIQKFKLRQEFVGSDKNLYI